MASKVDLSVIGHDIILSGGSSQIYRSWKSEDMERFDAAYGADSVPIEIPNDGFLMFASEWMEMSPWRKGHRAQFEPTAFDASLAAIAAKEEAAFIYGDGEHKGFAFSAIANSLNDWGDPGSVKFWAGSEGLWAAFVPSDAPFVQDSVVANMKNGTIRQVSISAVPQVGENIFNKETQTKDWTISQARLREGSPVAEPKHKNTRIFLSSRPSEEENMTAAKETAKDTAETSEDVSLSGDKEFHFTASEFGSAVGDAVATIMERMQKAAPEKTQTIADSGPTAEPAAAESSDSSGGENVINLSSLKERLTAIGG